MDSFPLRYFRMAGFVIARHCRVRASTAQITCLYNYFRVPFRDGLERVPVPLAPVSSWVNLSRGHLAACLNPSNLKKSPTNANFNEQTKRFQTVCQLAVAFIVYSRTFFVPEQLVAFEFHNVELVVQEQLRPGVVMASASRVGIDKEFTQFVFSFMVEILNLSLVSFLSFACVLLFYLCSVNLVFILTLFYRRKLPSTSQSTSCFCSPETSSRHRSVAILCGIRFILCRRL